MGARAETLAFASKLFKDIFFLIKLAHALLNFMLGQAVLIAKPRRVILKLAVGVGEKLKAVRAKLETMAYDLMNIAKDEIAHIEIRIVII